MYDIDSAEDKLKDIYELTRLYDTYGALLADHNRIIFEDYVLNNFSLGEIADEQDISRQGVRDVVVRSSKKLKDFEEKLKFVSKLDEASALIDELSNYSDSTEVQSIIDRLRKTLDI